MNNMMKKVAITLEHPLRELDQAVLIKIALEKEYGILSDISGVVHSTHINLLGRKQIIISPWGYGDHEYDYIFGFAENLYQGFIKIVFWQEQVLNEKTKKIFLPKGRSLNNVDYHLVWGENFAKHLISGGVSPSQIFIVGSPRIDMLNENFISSYTTKEELAIKYNIPVGKKWILFPSSFGLNFLLPNVKKLIQKMGYDDIVSVERTTQKKFEKFIDVIKIIAEQYTDVYQIIVRPHPSEPEHRFKKLFKDYNNVHVHKTLPISWWINSSDYVCSTTSTTLIDSYILKKKVIVLDFRDNDDVKFGFTRFFPNVHSGIELCTLIDSTISTGFENYYQESSRELDLFIQNNYSIDRGPSYQRISFVINNLIEKSRVKNKFSVKNILIVAKFIISDFLKSMLLAGPWGKLIATNYFSKRKRDYLSSKVVKRKTKLYRNIIQDKSSNIQYIKTKKTNFGILVYDGNSKK
jgi:surface carbohydrate biosynthesis protein